MDEQFIQLTWKAIKISSNISTVHIKLKVSLQIVVIITAQSKSL